MAIFVFSQTDAGLRTNAGKNEKILVVDPEDEAVKGRENNQIKQRENE